MWMTLVANWPLWNHLKRCRLSAGFEAWCSRLYLYGMPYAMVPCDQTHVPMIPNMAQILLKPGHDHLHRDAIQAGFCQCLSKRAKDMGSAAVLLSLALVSLVWGAVIWVRLEEAF